MKKNILVIHGGAPTAVMNGSLYGVIDEGKKHADVGKIFGAIGGSGGVLREDFCNLSSIDSHRLSMLLQTPASAIGTSRDPLEETDYKNIVNICQKHDISCVLINGGNGSMDACGKIKAAAAGTDIAVMGIPKTIDNDIAVTDHSPGFGSAAKYIAATASEIAQDLKALPIHVCVLEAMGRNAGWIAAASALAREVDGAGPDLIYMPEVAFDQDKFLTEVERLYKQKGWVLVVACEGLKDNKGVPIVEPIFQTGRSVYYGDVSAQLSTLIIKELGIKARNEKPGICGRASIAFQSEVDIEEALIAGRVALLSAIEGKSGYMVGFKRMPGNEYKSETFLIPVEEVMLHERTLPSEFIAPSGFDITKEFTDWCKPLIGSPLRQFTDFKQNKLI